MDIRRVTGMTPAEEEQTLTVLADSFLRTPLFRTYLFHGRRAPARTFLLLLLRFTLKTGRTYVGVDPNRGVVACALWSTPESPEMKLHCLFRLGLWPLALRMALQSPASVPRVFEMFKMLDRYAPEEPYATLEFLASGEKGVGAALVRRGIADFMDTPLYVESIVSKNDHAYYRQFGFQLFARTDFHGTDYAFLLRKAQRTGA
jgi:hypothetical protein